MHVLIVNAYLSWHIVNAQYILIHVSTTPISRHDRFGPTSTLTQKSTTKFYLIPLKQHNRYKVLCAYSMHSPWKDSSFFLPGSLLLSLQDPTQRPPPLLWKAF